MRDTSEYTAFPHTRKATRNKRQVNLALAGTQFSVSPGPPWWAFLPRTSWPEGLEASIKVLQERPVFSANQFQPY